MRIAVIGASGKTGGPIMAEGLKRGHDVLGLARSPQKIKIDHPRLEIRKVDVFDLESLERGLQGADVAITSVGNMDPRDRSHENFSTESHRNILAAMRAADVPELLVISSFGAARHIKREGLRRNLYLWMRRRYFDDMEAMEQMVLASGLDATVVRAPMLHNRAPLHNWLITEDGTLPNGLAIGRADLASFLITAAETGRYSRRTVALADEGDRAPSVVELLLRRDPAT